MGLSRSARIAILAAVGVLAAGGLFALGRSGTGRAGPVSTTAAPPGTEAPSTTTSTTVPAADPVYGVKEVRLVIAARNNAGSPVTIPTTVWYPETAGSARFPLVVFSPGYQIDPSAYEVLTTAWAAAGYVVAEPSYPDTAAGAPAVESDMVNHPGELSQVLTTLLSSSEPYGQAIDPAEVAVAGQSDGGDVSLAAAANSCCTDHRIKAAVILSGAEATLFGGRYYGSAGPPELVVQGDKDTVNPPGCSAQLYDGAGTPRYYLGLPTATHLSAYTAPPGPQVAAVKAVTIAFLDGYLKGMASRLTHLPALTAASGVARLISGTATVPVTGTCPGAPGAG